MRRSKGKIEEKKGFERGEAGEGEAEGGRSSTRGRKNEDTKKKEM